MDHHGLVKRVKPEYEEVVKNVAVTHQLLRLELDTGETVAAFRLVDMHVLNAAMQKIHERRGIKPTLEMQRALKPLTLELRRRQGLTSAMEWMFLERLFEKAEPEKGRQYPVYLLNVSYLWVEMPARPGAPDGILAPQFDPDAYVGAINTGEMVTL